MAQTEVRVVAIKLNNGAIINTPIILYGEPEDTSTLGERYDYTNDPFFYYKRGENAAIFGFLRGYLDDVDALEYSFTNPAQAYSMCSSLAAVGWHHADYFYEDAEGGEMIAYILQRVAWIIGDYNHGGVGLCKFASNGRYGFISFDGIHTQESTEEEPVENPYVYYAFSSSAYQSGDLQGGHFSRSELIASTFCWYTNWENNSYPPLWLFYQPDGYNWGYVSEFERIPPGPSSITTVFTTNWEVDSVNLAMSVSDWFEIGVTGNQKIPKRPFLCCYVDQANDTITYDRTKGLVKIADSLGREGYSRDGSFYGRSQVNPYENPFANVEDNKSAGGNGQWTQDNDDGGWTTPDQFETDALNAGLLTLYSPTKAEVKEFNNFLFTDIDDSMSQQLKRLISNPLEYVVFLAMCHFDPPLKNGKDPIKFCGIDSGVDASVVSHQMMSINCGSIDIVEKSQTATFLSYSPYFKMRLYLPYIGIVDLDDACMDSMINVTYWIDLLSGSCVAQITIKHERRRCSTDIIHNEGDTIAYYNGNVYQHLPLSASDWRGLYQGIIQFAGGAAAAATGNGAGFGAMASAVMGEKVHAQRSGAIGSNYGYISYQKPFLLFERPNLAMPVSEFGGYKGWIANISKPIGDFTGYTEVKADCWWNGTRTVPINGITEEESDMLKEVFESGVYLNWEG